MEIIVFIVIIVVGYKVYELFESLYYKLPHKKEQQRIRNEKYKDDLLGKNKLNEYHYHQDYDLITKYEKGIGKCWSNFPSVWIGDEVKMLWYFDKNIYKKHFHTDYKVIGFDEYKIIKSDELVIERRVVRKNYDTTEVLEIGDTIYFELVKRKNDGVVKETLSLTDLSFNYSTKFNQNSGLSKENLKIITFKNQDHSIISYYPHIMLLEQMIKNIIVLKRIVGVRTKCISKWRFYTHLELCRNIPIDIEKKDIYLKLMKLDKYILSFQQREINPITKSQYFSEIQNSILKRNSTPS